MSSLPASLFPSFPSADQQHHQAHIHLAVQRVLDSGCFILGEEVAAFESEFAAFLGVKHVVGVGSGTDAIELILRALGIGAGSKVAVPSFAPSAVASGVVRMGAVLNTGARGAGLHPHSSGVVGVISLEVGPTLSALEAHP